MNGVQTRFKCKLDVKRCKRFVFPPSSLLPRSNALKTKAIRYFQTDRTLTRIVSPPLLVASGTHSLLSADGTPLWLVQKGKFAYRILPEYTREAFVTCETRPTDWVKRNKVNEKKQGLPSEARILRLWANHGQRPVDDTYGYVVYAGRQIPSDELPFRVLQNDTLVQAVCSMDGKVVEAVLYPGNKGLQAEGLSLSASAPCAVLIREEAGEIVVSVTDACMNAALKGIRIVLNGREIKVPMPQGMLCGKPAVIRVDRMTNQ